MEKLKALGRRLFRDKNAATAMIFAISTPLVVGGAALAIDIAGFRIVQSRMQSAVDAGALAAVMQIELKKKPVEATAVDMVVSNVPADFGNMTTAADVTIGTYSKAAGFMPGGGANANAVRVVGIREPARGNGLNRLFGLLFGNGQVDIQVTAIAARPANVFYEPPEGLVMDSNAGDFNEMYAYCYDMKSVDPDISKRRSQMTLIANNLPVDASGNYTQTTSSLTGGVYTAMPGNPMPWPDCKGKDQSLSFMLKNWRHRKGHPGLWSNPDLVISGRTSPKNPIEHYTDTTISNGVETFNNGTLNILETVLCTTSDRCNPSKSPTDVPKGTNRQNTKSTNSAGCSPGKFVYFGFEDRPGGPGAKSSWLDPDWTDFDYNDIAIRMKCPSGGKLADPYPRLVG
jgi:hypothetical protein